MADDAFLKYFDRFVKWPARLGKEGPFIEGILQEAGAKRVVDAGAGTGRHAGYLAQRGYEVIAADIAECMVEETNRYAGELGVSLTAVQCGFEDLPAHIDEPVDAVICLGNSLSMLPDREAVLRACRGFASVLNPAGVCLVHVLNYRGLRLKNKRVSRPTVLEDGGLLIKIFDLEPEATRVNLVRLAEREPGVWSTDHQWAPLLPLSREELTGVMEESGFCGFHAFGSADGTPYEPDGSWDLFLRAKLRE
ncbi:MAG: class I SAM-dependent methyltransferase [Planctomycetota bacterium]|jgi:SAM-dependent methyltransferase